MDIVDTVGILVVTIACMKQAKAKSRKRHDVIRRPYNDVSYKCARLTWAVVESKYSGKLFKSLFRMEKSKVEISRWMAALRIPDANFSVNGVKTSGLEAMLIFIRVMASRTKYNDLLIEIGLTDERMCRIVTGIRSYIFGNIQKKLCSLDHEFVISESKLESYRKALQDQGNPLKGCIGFCDGTNFQINRPRDSQRVYYSGHKKHHAVKILVVMLPTGIMIPFGTWPGSFHDSRCAQLIDLDKMIEENCGSKYCLFLDPAFKLSGSLITQYRRSNNLDFLQREFNRRMCAQRVLIEHQIGRMKILYPSLSNPTRMRSLWSETEETIMVGVHLTNIHSCIYGNQVQKFFKVRKESLNVYLKNF